MTTARRFATGILFGLVVGLALAIVAPLAFGWRSLTVMSGSMSPTIATGDAVVVQSVSPLSLRPGDVTTFDDPEGTGRLITHRVRGVRRIDDALEVTTKGDANSATERWRVSVDGRVGRVVYRVPRVGYVLAPTASPVGRLVLVALPAVVLGALGLRTIWRRPSTPDGYDEA